MKRIAGYSMAILLVVSLGCGKKMQSTINEEAAAQWVKPMLLETTDTQAAQDRGASTNVYWNNLKMLVDSAYNLDNESQYGTTRTLQNAGATVCRLIANEISNLPTRNVDEDAIMAGQATYNAFLSGASFYHDFPSGALAENPEALGDPGSAYGAGTAFRERHLRSLRDAQSELVRARALLESRYGEYEFVLPHPFPF